MQRNAMGGEENLVSHFFCKPITDAPDRTQKMDMFTSLTWLIRSALCVVALCAILAHGADARPAFIDRTPMPIQNRDQPMLTKQIDAAVNNTMRRFSIPGLAVVFVEDGRVAYQKGFGISALKTELNKGARVESTTLFKVGSISKSITALGLALLVQDGKVKFDDALSRHIPELIDANPLVAKLTIRQILSHQTGLDLDRLEPLLWPQPNQFRFANFVTGLHVLGASAVDNSTFKYSNLNYALAGEIVQRATGLSYNEFVRTRIFQPLDMHCLVIEGSASTRSRLAQPHMLIAGAVQMVRPDDGQVTEGLDAAAGGIRCDAEAMGKWLLFQLSPRTSRLKIADSIWQDLHAGLAVSRTVFDCAMRPIEIETYGLGIQLVMADSEFRFDHYGGVAGMLAYYAVYPSRGTGFAILMNMNSLAARKVLIERLAAVATRHKITAAAPTRASAALTVPAKPIATKSLDADASETLFGRYRDAWFGDVSLCRTISGGAFTSTLSPRLRGRIVSLDEVESPRIAILWDDQAVNSDAIINVTETRDSKVQRFTLAPLAESDFDFSAMNFRRIGDCP